MLSVLTLSGAQAATDTTTFQVTANVQSTCVIDSAATLAFGTYTGVQTDATSDISVTCTIGTTFEVGLNAGLAPSATVTTRAMQNGGSGNLLPYDLFRDAGRTTNWGNTVASDTEPGTGTGVAQTLVVYGRIPAGEFVTPGGYADTITVTLTF